ncbi:MAG: chemotaxis protein CheB [Saccharofermentanales bacterium]
MPAKKNVDVDNRGFPIVGIGASAGGLAAFEAFFSGMPSDADTGMAFILVQHLAPDHKSILDDLIQRHTRMKVFEVENGMKVMPDCTYIIPPDFDMAFSAGTLKLTKPAAPRGQRLPIDFLFCSLARELHERAISIVLSGTGSDGTLGVRCVKGEGGMVMVQDPSSAEYDGMPGSVIATGLADYELMPAEMPKKIMEYVENAYNVFPLREMSLNDDQDNALKKIFSLLRARTGNDFSLYKPNTVHRRIQRRMAVHKIKEIDDYVKYIQQTPAEVDLIFRDLLIGVTNFFRDPDAFKAFEEKAVPMIFDDKIPGSAIRVWIPGCSTGEEAYSIAIIMQEKMESYKKNYAIQIFATDIDSQSISIARAGNYSAGIAADVSPERLARFFTLEPGSGTYRINKSIRDMIVFSEQNIIKDPPFSKLDLISCRNLLIYLGGDLQKRLIPLFHYSLTPGSILFLGSSESVGEFDNLFTILDRKSKIYKRKENLVLNQKDILGNIIDYLPVLDKDTRMLPKKPLMASLSYKELTEQAILQQSGMVAALVSETGDILYIHSHMGMYLEITAGETGAVNVLKMAREGLQRELAVAFKKAVSIKESITISDIKIKTNDHFNMANLHIKPIIFDVSKPMLYIIILEEIPEIDKDALTGNQTDDTDVRIESLRRELRSKEEYLQTANEELETSNEELKSSNEEMQSVNEELQSTNEELETSKEELQSVNEELSTVNTELQTKVHDLNRVNNDMNNLLAGTGIATVFVDHQLRIMRFTPNATIIINLIQSDVGRPVTHLVSNLIGYKQLGADVKIVLDTLVTKEIEVQTIDAKWYMMRIQPYRTIDNVIEGAVLTFVDITDIKKAQNDLADSEIRYRRLFETAKNGILMIDAESGTIMDINPFLIKMLGFPRSRFIDKKIWDAVIFKDIIIDKKSFMDIQKNENARNAKFSLKTSKGRQIEVEFIYNIYMTGKKRIVQFDIRDIEC